MFALNLLDATALAYFIAAWVLYARFVESSRFGRTTLNAMMHVQRMRWMERMLVRDVRIIDTQIMGSLQNGTAFFASTSLFAIGGALSLLRAADDVLRVFSDLPFGIQASRGLWELKVIGLTVIFVYAFFKFAWSYRLFNYAAILLGATPPLEEATTPEAQNHVRRLAGLTTAAGNHFNRGQRAFFYALGYLGWFLSPLVFIGTTTAVLVVMALRQYHSDGRSAVAAGIDPDME
jgi:uncharacterized membrane protein